MSHLRRTVPGLISLILLSCSGGESPAPASTPPPVLATTGGSPASSGGGGTAGASSAGAASVPVAGASGGSSTGGVASPATAGGSIGTSNGGTTAGGAPGAITGGVAAGGISVIAGGASGGTPIVVGGAPNGGVPGVAGTGGTAPADLPPAGGNGSLKDKFVNYFPIGAAVDANGPTSHGELLSKHFNSVTPENEMKFSSLQPTEGQFTYGPADRIVQYAQQNGMKIRGHALVWHSQNPDWLWQQGGGTVSKQTLLARMKAHIDAVAKHFRGKVYCWDVVNEAVMNDGHLRGPNEPEGQKSRWLEIIGEDYIAEAFRYAHEADPDAKLFYNDFYNYIPEKQQAIYELMKKLLAAGVPVHGVGMQAHLNIEPSTDPTNQAYYQNVENLEKAIQLYSSLGLEVQVTELDMSLYIPGVMYTEATFYTPSTFTAELKAKQAARYKAFFDMFRRYHKELTGVTFWGIADDNTWLSEFTSMRQDFPLLFDTSHKAKPSYDSVMDW